VRVCNEILKDPNSFNMRVLCKVLTCLEMSEGNNSKLKELKVLAKNLLDVRTALLFAYLEKSVKIAYTSHYRMQPLTDNSYIRNK